MPTFSVRTSDRIAFRNCRRAWAWSNSSFPGVRGRQSNQVATPLWLGSAIHHALERYHGYHKKLEESFLEFVKTTRREGNAPDDATIEETKVQGLDMLSYYEKWLNYPGRPKYKTWIHNGKPAVEVGFEIPIQTSLDLELRDLLEERSLDRLVYRGTIDRIAEDELGILWIFEYKTAARYEIMHLETDPQVSAYLWAVSVLFPGKTFGGVIYQQHHKSPPQAPRILANGKLSTAATQNTTGILYREALQNLYGSVTRAPQPQRAFYEKLLVQEGENQDKGVRWDIATRSSKQISSELPKIIMEVKDMLRYNIYPSPTRSCRWCDFEKACIALDSGYDYKSIIENTTIER